MGIADAILYLDSTDISNFCGVVFLIIAIIVEIIFVKEAKKPSKKGE